MDNKFTVENNYQKNYSFQKYFSNLRKKLQIKLSRKNNIDSLLKKVKGKFFKSINNCVKECLNIKIKKLPQKFITNITIQYNQNYLNKNVLEIYNEFHILPNDYEKFMKNHNKEYFKILISYNLKELFEIFLESDRYKNELKKIQQKFGKKNGILFEFVSKNFINYYINSKAHLFKEKNNNENNDENQNENQNLNQNNKNIDLDIKNLNDS
jgi:hypothetical protein